MKMYVVGYQQRKEGEPLADPMKPWENVDVQYSPKRGDWIINDHFWAQQELQLLTSMRVRVGEHACRFQLEEDGGCFAIVCPEHPAPQGSPAA